MFSVASSQANDNLHDEQIAHTREIWRPRVGRDLSREDASRIASNVTGFPHVLAEWSRAEKQFRVASDDEAHQAAKSRRRATRKIRPDGLPPTDTSDLQRGRRMNVWLRKSHENS